jgi:hypothetical protein
MIHAPHSETGRIDRRSTRWHQPIVTQAAIAQNQRDNANRGQGTADRGLLRASAPGLHAT